MKLVETVKARILGPTSTKLLRVYHQIISMDLRVPSLKRSFDYQEKRNMFLEVHYLLKVYYHIDGGNPALLLDPIPLVQYIYKIVERCRRIKSTVTNTLGEYSRLSSSRNLEPP